MTELLDRENSNSAHEGLDAHASTLECAKWLKLLLKALAASEPQADAPYAFAASLDFEKLAVKPGFKSHEIWITYDLLSKDATLAEQLYAYLLSAPHITDQDSRRLGNTLIIRDTALIDSINHYAEQSDIAHGVDIHALRSLSHKLTELHYQDNEKLKL